MRQLIALVALVLFPSLALAAYVQPDPGGRDGWVVDTVTNGLVLRRAGTDVLKVSSSGDVTIMGGAGSLTCNDGNCSLVVTDNDATAFLIGSVGQLGLLTIDSGNATETVVINGTTTTDALHVNVGDTQLDEDLTVTLSVSVGTTLTSTGDATFNGGPGAVTFGAGGTVVIPDASATFCVGSTGDLDLVCYDTTEGLEKFVLKGTTTQNALHVDVGDAQFDEDVTATGDVTSSGGAGAFTCGAASCSLVATDNSATGFVMGAAGATGMLAFDTTNGEEKLIPKAMLAASPQLIESWGYGASKGITTMRYDGAAFTGATGVVHLAQFASGSTIGYASLGAGQTLNVVMSASGLDIGADQADNEGYELWGGNPLAGGRPFYIGVDPAFKVCLTSTIGTPNGTDDWQIGFRRAEVINAAVNSYTDYAAWSINTAATPAALRLESEINGAAAQDADTTETWDGTSKVLCVLVSAAGVVTFTNAGSAPVATMAVTFDDGDPVVWFWRFLHATAAQAGAVTGTHLAAVYQ